MSIGRWELHTMGYKAEANPGVDAGAPYAALWHNTSGLVATRETLRSDRALGNRRRPHSRLGLKGGAGDIVCEWCYSIHDPFILAAIGAASFKTPWTAITFTAGAAGCTITVSGTEATFTDAGAASKFTDVAVGDIFVTTGFATAANNGTWICTVKTSANSIKAQGYNTPVAVSLDNATFTCQAFASDGTTEESFTIWSRHTDLDPDVFFQFLYSVVNTLQLNLTPDEIVKFTMGIMAANVTTTASEPGVPVQPTTIYDPFDCLSGIVTVGGTASTKITTARIDVANNYRATKAIGSVISEEMIPGKFEISGQMSVYFDTVTQFNNFWGETETRATFQLTDGGSNDYTIHLPSLKWLSYELTKSDDGPCMANMNFEACSHPYMGTSLFIIKA